MSDYERLKSAIQERLAVVVVGTGLSKALTNGASSADWLGLVRSGIERCRLLGESADWASLQETSLNFAAVEPDLDQLISVASMVAAKLRARGDQAYSDWLRDEIGGLEVSSVAVANAIAGLELPVFTTNYDTLLERALERPSACWSDREAMRAVFRKESRAIGHLHGLWTDPTSVVLSEADYQRLLEDTPAQFLQSAHYATRSFIFVGYGSGLADPNFGKMLALHRAMFPESRGDHFRLCTDAEVDELVAAHAGEDIRVVSFGADHSSLAEFLSQLRPERDSLAVSGDSLGFARFAVLDRVRSDAIVAEHIADIESCAVEDLVVAPVLLPLPHEQFASARSLDHDVRPERLDPSILHEEAKVLIVAGEELSGVTTAILWLLSSASGATDIAPIYVDGRVCTPSARPLDRQVRRESLAHRLIDRGKDDLPPHLLAVDNVKPAPGRVYEGIVADLMVSACDYIIIGCRQGDEFAIAADLASHRLPVQFAFVGKLAVREVSALAKMIAPQSAPSLSREVLGVIKREHLPRSPFTASLLLVLFAHGNKSALHNSETAVLNEYVNLLLGRNGQYVDPRWSLDPQNREIVLAELAKELVQRRRGAVSQSEAVEIISAVFARLDWSESALDTLESFRIMRILRVQHDVVQFQQTSYFHLFAAKAAIDDADFLDILLADPVFFAPIVRHYAALVRNSERVVGTMRDLLAACELDEPQGRIFGTLAELPSPPESPSGAQGDIEDDVSRDEPEELLEDHEDDYDYSDDADGVPFPLSSVDTWDRTSRLAWIVDLASRVLRDSDQIANPDLKNALLLDALDCWGYLLELLERDRVFVGASERITSQLIDDGMARPERRKEVEEVLALMLPSFVVYAGMSTCLSSRKLLLAFERLAHSKETVAAEYGFATAAMFSIDVNERGWATALPDIGSKHGKKWVVGEFLFMLAYRAFRYQALSPEDEAALMEFLRNTRVQRYTFDSDAARRAWLARFEQKTRRGRALASQKRLEIGEKATDLERPEP